MPVPRSEPKPIRDAVHRMETIVASFKSSLAYSAPEQEDLFYIRLQENLVDLLYDTYEAGKGEDA